MGNAADRTLSKTRFKEGFECPTRLFYRRHRDEYPCDDDEDPFLEQLAQGGFQVGALARLGYPDGVLVETLDLAEAERETIMLMKRHDVVIFEAAIRANSLIARVDILVKTGDHIRLLEVKSKSFDGDSSGFWHKKPEKDGSRRVISKWLPYLVDVAFQTLVCRRNWPNLTVTPYLVCMNKKQRASVDGLHQKLRVEKAADGRANVTFHGRITKEDLSNSLLQEVPVAEEVERLMSGEASGRVLTLAEEADLLSEADALDKKLESQVGSKCRECPYRPALVDDKGSFKSGFEACWQKAFPVTKQDLRTKPLLLDIPKVRGYLKLLDAGVVFQEELSEEQVLGGDCSKEKEALKPGMQQPSRYWKRIQKERQSDTKPFIDRAGLRAEMETWRYPLHFIDFETMSAAIPFHRGLRPYEVLAFQFSHHTLDEDGKVTHRRQWIEARPGVFPNFEFVRELRQSLGLDGSVFCYAHHENTVLLQILRQIQEHEHSLEDKEALSAWIKSVTIARNKSPNKAPYWRGERLMVDLKDVLERFVLLPEAKGSYSLKSVLPACMTASAELKRKYSQPFYGKTGGVFSHNFSGMVWWKPDDNGNPIDPYILLGEDGHNGDKAQSSAKDINEAMVSHGPEAMAAFERLQYVDLSDREREAWIQSLYRYCELDTLAMVMLVESWRAEIFAHD